MNSININQLKICNVKNCGNKRIGYSGYCKHHKYLYNSTGSLDQFYLPDFNKYIQKYIHKTKEYINLNKEIFSLEIIKSKRLLDNPKSYFSALNIDIYTRESCKIRLRDTINSKTLKMIRSYRYDEIDFLSRVIAVHLFQKENQYLLKLGSGFIFHIGKAIWLGFGLERKYYKHRLGSYMKRDNLSRLQYVLLGGVAFTTFTHILTKFNVLIEKDVKKVEVFEETNSLKMRPISHAEYKKYNQIVTNKLKELN